jgi:hypothetical protein
MASTSSIASKLDTLKQTKAAIKDAIVEKGVSVGDTDSFRSYASKISSIETKGKVQDNKEVDFTESPMSVKPDDGYDSMEEVTVNAKLGTKEVTPTSADQTFVAASEDLLGYSSFVVKAGSGSGGAGGGDGPFTVTFQDANGNVLYTAKNVPKHGYATFVGQTPTNDGQLYVGWNPLPSNIVADTVCKPIMMSTNDYPTNPQELTDFTWDQIVASINAGQQTLIPGMFKTIDLGTFGIIRMMFIGYGLDVGAATTWVSMDLTAQTAQFAKWNTDNNHDVIWEKSHIRNDVMPTYLQALPAALQADTGIKEVTKYSSSYDYDAANSLYLQNAVTQDRLWIPSYREIFGGTSHETAGNDYTGIFKDRASRIRKKYQGDAKSWWLRSGINNPDYVRCVYDNGDESYDDASDSHEVLLGFCI